MSLDSSLKAGASLSRHRNVLTRTERLARLLDAADGADNEVGILGMKKISNRKITVGKKTPKKTEDEGDGKKKKKK